MQLSRLIVLLSFVWLLAACQSAAVKDRSPGQLPAVAVHDNILLIAETAPAEIPEAGLTSDIIFNLLAGEVAAQRGALQEAYRYQYQSARLARDATSAERATRLALHLEAYDQAIEAAELWVELAPEDLAARQLLVVMILNQDAKAPVLGHLKAIVELSNARDENGFLNALSALNQELKHAPVMELMRRLVEEFPGDPRGPYALAVNALVEKDFVVAEQQATRLVADHPDWPQGYLVLGRLYAAQGNTEKARELMAEATGRFPDEPLLISAYARLLVESKALQEAYDQFLKLEAIDHEGDSASYWLGLLALELDNEEQARTHFLRLVELNKRVDVAAYYLGRLAEDADQPRRAIEWYQRVKGGDHSAEAQARTVRLMAQLGEIDQARDWIQRMRIQHPEQSVRYYLIEAELLQEHGTDEQVMTLFDTALSAVPDSNQLLYARGLFAATLNRVDILESDLLQVINSDPAHADALNALGYTLADQTNRYQEAFDYIQRALDIKPDSAAIMDSMGWVLYRMGRHQEAISFLKQAFEQMPDPEIAAHLGEVLWMTGEQQQAQKIWQETLEKTPESEHLLEVIQRLQH